TAFGHDRTWAVVPFDLPVSRTYPDLPFRPDRLTGVALAHHLPGLRHRAVARHRNLTDMLLVHRPIGAVGHRHLIFLPHGLAHRVGAGAHVLFVDRPTDRVLADDVVVLPDRLAHGIAAVAEVLLVDRLTDGIAALFHDGPIDRAIADAGLVLDHSVVTDTVA